MFANIIDTSTRKIPYCARFLNADFQINIVKFWISFQGKFGYFSRTYSISESGV